MVSLIVAVNDLGYIGLNNDLIIKDKQDLSHFKEVTNGKVVVMGRKTWDSLPNKPLPNRTNLIVSRTLSGENIYSSLEAVLDKYGNDDIYIIGGSDLYNYALTNGLVEQAWVTFFNDKTVGDTRLTYDFMKFPVLDVKFFDNGVAKLFKIK